MQRLQQSIYSAPLDFTEVKALYWDKEYTMQEIANKFNISLWALYTFMKKYKIERRNFSQANYVVSNRLKPQFKIKQELSSLDEKLKVAGIMLYWAEGTLNRNTVDFVNSNPRMIKVFLRFLREICGVSEKRLRLYLYVYSYHNVRTIMEYWHKVTAIPVNQFTKPYVRKGSLNKTERKLVYGLVHIRYNDKRLLQIIKDWIEEYIK